MSLGELNDVLAHSRHVTSTVVGEGSWVQTDGAGERAASKNADRARATPVNESNGSNLHSEVECDRRTACLAFEAVNRDDRRLSAALRDHRLWNDGFRHGCISRHRHRAGKSKFDRYCRADEQE